MSLEFTQIYNYLIIDFFVVLTFLFGLFVLWKIYLKRESLEGIKRNFLVSFGLIVFGYLLYSIAEIGWSYIQFVLEQDPTAGVMDYFWIVGVFFLFFGFLHLNSFLLKNSNKKVKNYLILGLVGFFSGVIIFYLITTFIMGNQAGESSFEFFLDYFYPISSMILLVLSFNIYLFFKEFDKLKWPFLLLAVSTLFAFIGDTTYTYYAWNDIYGVVGLVSDISYSIGYLFSSISFYVMFKILNIGSNKNGKKSKKKMKLKMERKK
jgi:uncharacterized membrane protein